MLMSTDYVIGVAGDYRLGLNEVAIGLTVPGFAVELARYRLHPAAFRRTVTAGYLFSPEEACDAGLLDVLATDEGEAADLAQAKAEALLAVDRPSFRGTKEKMHAEFLARFDAVVEAELAQ